MVYFRTMTFPVSFSICLASTSGLCIAYKQFRSQMAVEYIPKPSLGQQESHQPPKFNNNSHNPIFLSSFCSIVILGFFICIVAVILLCVHTDQVLHDGHFLVLRLNLAFYCFLCTFLPLLYFSKKPNHLRTAFETFH